MCVRNVDVHVSCSSQVDAQLAAFFIDPRAKEGDVGCRRGAKTRGCVSREAEPGRNSLKNHRARWSAQRVVRSARETESRRISRNTAMRTTLESLLLHNMPGVLSRFELSRSRHTPRHRWRRVSAHAVVASHKLFSPLDLAILLERSVASRDGRSDEEWEGGADSEDAMSRLPGPFGQGTQADSFSVARVRPRTSKGITDLLLLNLVRLEAACPSKKICLYVGSKTRRPKPGPSRYHKLWFPGSCPPSHRRNFGGSLAGIVYDLPSNGSSLKDLKCTHSDYGASDESRIVIFPVSQAPSPESNPDSPLPVTTMVGAEPTIDNKHMTTGRINQGASCVRSRLLAVEQREQRYAATVTPRGRAVRVSCVVNAAGTFRADVVEHCSFNGASGENTEAPVENYFATAYK
ncbi:hypothetical protein PUN28_017871 [Cardiocondyla obscurior]|uniref:Uncharacterized protein n=1 Tax=Cardiocondyla obscurior TaxID=286306 RepID=A0AAW2EN38_9HYME